MTVSQERAGGLVYRIGELVFSTGVRRKFHGTLGHVLRFYAAATAVFTIYNAAFSDWDSLARMIVFLCLMLVLIFLVVGHGPKANPLRPTALDWGLSLLSFASLVFFTMEVEAIAVRLTLFDPLSPAYYFFGLSLIVLSLEAARRTVGLGLTAVVGVFIAYNLYGHLLKGFMSHGYISLEHFIDITVFTSDGLFSVPIQVTATYAFLFVMFGTLLERAGGGAFFFDLAAALTGRKIGGPAKVAVVSSAAFGTISGSPTADVVTTGSVTIPMMKRLGYRPRYAAAVEVAASTGGSIMPPVMGSAVFIMAEFTGIAYVDIVVASLVPALVYYLGIYLQVHLRSKRLGHKGLEADQIPTLAKTFRSGGLFLIPLITLVVALAVHYTPTYVALFGIVSIMVVWLIRRAGFSLFALYDALAQTTLSMAAVTGACAAAGLVIGGITMTGLAGKVSDMIIFVAGSSLFVTLLITAGCVILLGMGMPTPAAYALAAAVLAPTLTQDFGLPLIQAHLFLLYFTVLSAMTPPVAVAAYAASAIADSNPLGIAISACQLAVAAFILPFAFIYNPGITLAGDLSMVTLALVSIIAVVVLVSIAAEGYWNEAIPSWVRLVMLISAGCIFIPGLVTTSVGAALLVVCYLGTRTARNRAIGKISND